MSGNERRKQETQNREMECWRRRVEGETQQEIADALGITQQAVSLILRRLGDRFAIELSAQAAEIKARQTEQLELVYREAIQQWRRSCEDGEKTTTVDGRTKILGEEVVPLAPLVTYVVEGQSGNPALLAQAMKALADIRAIYGLEAAKKSEVSGPQGGPIEIDTDSLRRELNSRMVRLSTASVREAAADPQPEGAAVPSE